MPYPRRTERRRTEAGPQPPRSPAPTLRAMLHPDIAVLAPLLGTWTGAGTGDYPTIDAFTYVETISFTHVGKPFLAYTQRTRHPDTEGPMHSETGYWRVPAPDRLEIVMAQPTGLTEIYEGGIGEHGGVIVMDVRSPVVGATSTAKEVTVTERTFELDGDELRYTFRMAAVGQPLQHHLAATLRRTAEA